MYNRESTWGQKSFDDEARWYGRLRHHKDWASSEKTEYQEIRKSALEDPEFDFFEHYMPTGRPKYDIGRYVMRYGIRVPIIRSMQEWQTAMLEGTAMLRSEHRQDYNGYGGLFTTGRVYRELIPPRDQDGHKDPVYYQGLYRGQNRAIEGPLEAAPPKLIGGYVFNENLVRIGSNELNEKIEALIMQGLMDGEVDPNKLMYQLYWRDDLDDAKDKFERFGREMPDELQRYIPQASLWRYKPGINVRIVRDECNEGTYYIAGSDSHHTWKITQGRDSPDIEAYSKAVFRGYKGHEDPEYILPTQKIVDLYEKVRTLPLFDTTQAPLLELLSGEDGQIYFLQYFKTGNRITTPSGFDLSKHRDGVVLNEVRGATKPEGEAVRIYVSPPRITDEMKDQAILPGYVYDQSMISQIASKLAHFVFVVDGLNFKDNHYDSAPLYMARVALGANYEIESRLNSSHISYSSKEIEYVDAHITSNGIQAVVESDWEIKKDR